MQGPPCLEQLYPDLAGLFVNYLAVPKTSIRPAYEQLLEFTSIATGFDYADYAKSLLWSLNELLIADSESPPSFKDAVHSRVFPVILPNGDHQMLTALDSFAINDREHYALHLRGRIKLLDFSMEDIRKLRPFIKWAGLSGRYLSQLVTEKTEFEGIYDPEKSLKRDLVRKASAFVRLVNASVNQIEQGPNTF